MFTDYTVSAEVTSDGRLELTDRAAFSKAMRHFKRGRVTVRIQVDRGKRTTQQNRFYWLLLNLISEETGHEPDELHECFKQRFLQPRVKEVLGDEIQIYSTTFENYEDFWQYVERIRRFVLTDLGIETPDPDPELRRYGRRKKKEAA